MIRAGDTNLEFRADKTLRIDKFQPVKSFEVGREATVEEGGFLELAF